MIEDPDLPFVLRSGRIGARWDGGYPRCDKRTSSENGIYVIYALRLRPFGREPVAAQDEPKDEPGRMLRLCRWLTSFLKNIGEIRDGFLVSAGAFYLFGYLVWSINAYRNKVGLLSALDFQYFIAGIIPVTLLAILLALIIGVLRLRSKVKKTLVSGVRGWKLLVRQGLLVLWGISLILVLLQTSNWFQNLFSRAGLNVVVTLVILTFSGTSLFMPPLGEPSPSGKQGFRDIFKSLFESTKGLMVVESFLGSLFAWLIIVAGPSLAFAFFLSSVYPKTPQEFGGTRPRCAYLDIARAQISNETLSNIVTADQIKSSDPVLRSAQVEILFSGSDVMVIRVAGKVYQISKGSIQVVTNCE